ncbi:MAG: PTS ascorbate transporter subunit IIC [Ruminococcus sp.]|nr:PTS ascorbate transporter subunit IIC [Ruminococcus sp.]
MADKKAVPLRISEKLYSDLAAWAEDDFRSLNGQIEYLLTECVRQRRKTGGYVGRDIDKPLEVDLSDTNGNTNGVANAKKTDRG